MRLVVKTTYYSAIISNDDVMCFSRYGNSLVLVGSQDMREKALIPPDRDPSLSHLSDIQYCLLEVLGRSRQYGMFRTDLTKKFLKIDARSTFHHVKLLAKAGFLVVKVRRTFKYLFYFSSPLSPHPYVSLSESTCVAQESLTDCSCCLSLSVCSRKLV